jgi:hypothetical protein
MMKPQRYLIPLLLMAQGATAAEVVGPLLPVPVPSRFGMARWDQLQNLPSWLA